MKRMAFPASFSVSIILFSQFFFLAPPYVPTSPNEDFYEKKFIKYEKKTC